MAAKKENPRLQPGASEKPLQGTTHMNNTSTKLVNALTPNAVSPNSEASEEPMAPPSLWGTYIPVARYRTDEERLSPWVICYELRSYGETPVWAKLHNRKIPPQWLRGLPVVSRADEDLLLSPLIEATLEGLRGYGWIEELRTVVAWATRRGEPQAKFWGAVYDDVR